MNSILLSIAIGCVCQTSGNVTQHETISNPTLTTIFNRKSVRSYTGGKVSQDQLVTLVKAGMAAPTAVDRRPWDFIIINDPNTIKKLAEKLPYAKMLNEAGAAIIVTGDTKRQFTTENGEEYWMLDCSAASENILLAAESMGLGAVWTAVYPDKERIKAVRTLLNIPETVIPLNVIPIGIPTGKDKPKNKYNPKQIHRNSW
jgi:nitroreductase